MSGRAPVRAARADPNDPRLKGLENALQNVTKDREAARGKFDAAREKIKERDADRDTQRHLA